MRFIQNLIHLIRRVRMRRLKFLKKKRNMLAEAVEFTGHGIAVIGISGLQLHNGSEFM